MKSFTVAAVIDELVADLPWGERVRLVVGGLASRESVKDLLLERVDIVPSWISGTLPDLVRDILNKNKVSVDKPLAVASQCDALQKFAGRPHFRDVASELCTHLKDRSVARRVARFLTALEKSYASDGELDAVLECLAERDPERARFVERVVALWRMGELVPWGEGAAARRLLEWLDADGADAKAGSLGMPERIWLWGFDELTPLEETVLEKLAHRGVDLRFLVPRAALDVLKPRADAIGVTCVELEETRSAATVWHPHSAWDEAEFLRDELARLRSEGVAWSEIAFFVPNNDLYKRYLRQKLSGWNVPLRDPTLQGAWTDNADWLWWRDLLRVLSSGLRLDDVRAWLGPGPGRHELFEAAYKSAVHGGVGQWSRLAERSESHDLPELKLLLEAVTLFARAMSPEELLAAVERLVARATELLGTAHDGAPLAEFAKQLCVTRERPYLEGFRARLPRYLPLFEEYLEARSRFESLRADGVNFVGHGVWLPKPPKHAFVLGAETIPRRRPPADPWDWESVEARSIWSRVHFGFTFDERVRRDEALLLHGLRSVASNGTSVFSGARHDIDGRPLPETVVFKALTEGATLVAVSGGHPRTGWARAAAEPGAIEVSRPDLAPPTGPDAAPVRVTAFEDYLKCPFVYHARHNLKLEPEEELGLEVHGFTRGNVLHDSLERFIRDEIEGRSPALVAGGREAALARLRAIVSEEIRRKPLEGMYRHKPLIENATSQLMLLAERWLDWELENRAELPTLKPHAVERAIELALPGGLRLRGKADRIDTDGQHAVIVDYKSGGAPFKGKELIDGLGAQLLMYARAVQQSEKLEPAAAYYLTLKRKLNDSGGVFLKKHCKTLHLKNGTNKGLFDGEFDALYESVEAKWEEAARRLLAGDFTPRPARPKDDCKKCQFKTICGYDVPPDLDDDGQLGP